MHAFTSAPLPWPKLLLTPVRILRGRSCAQRVSQGAALVQRLHKPCQHEPAGAAAP